MKGSGLLLTTALVGAMVAAGGGGQVATGQQVSDRAMNEIVQSIRSLRTELQAQRNFREIQVIRDAQVQFLRSNGKFPDYLEVGTEIWMAVYDWHIRWQQPATVGRDGSNRYTMAMLGTTIIMRHDAQANFVGLPYDNR